MPESLFLISLQLQKRLWYRCFPPVAASGKTRTKSLKLAKFQFHLFLTALDIMGSLYIVTHNSCKTRQKNIRGGVHSY